MDFGKFQPFWRFSLRRAGAGPAAPPGPVRAGRRQFRGFLENSEIFSGIFLKIWEYFLKKIEFFGKNREFGWILVNFTPFGDFNLHM